MDDSDREALVAAFRVLGDLTRLRILDALMEGVHCNCEIAERLGLSLSLISHHLGVLQRAGFIEGAQAEEDARWIYYSVNQERIADLRAAVDRFLDVGRIKPRLPSCGPGKARCRG